MICRTYHIYKFSVFTAVVGVAIETQESAYKDFSFPY